MSAPEPWPFSALRVVSGDLELRYLDDDLLHAAALVAAEGIHGPDAMPFLFPWTRGNPVDVARSVLRYEWQARASLSPQIWNVELAVLDRGRLVGLQGTHATDFLVTRQASTASWLGLAHQGRGLGTRMRALILHLLFEGLGAERALTEAFADNAASNAVSRKLGYRENGRSVLVRDGQAAENVHYVLDRAEWTARPGRPHVTLHGVEGVRDYLGIGA